MPTRVTDDVYAALHACRALKMPSGHIGGSLGPHRFALLLMSGRPDRVSEVDKRAIARRLRQVALIFRLERDCQRGRYAGALGAE